MKREIFIETPKEIDIAELKAIDDNLTDFIDLEDEKLNLDYCSFFPTFLNILKENNQEKLNEFFETVADALRENEISFKYKTFIIQKILLSDTFLAQRKKDVINLLYYCYHATTTFRGKMPDVRYFRLFTLAMIGKYLGSHEIANQEKFIGLFTYDFQRSTIDEKIYLLKALDYCHLSKDDKEEIAELFYDFYLETNDAKYKLAIIERSDKILRYLSKDKIEKFHLNVISDKATVNKKTSDENENKNKIENVIFNNNFPAESKGEIINKIVNTSLISTDQQSLFFLNINKAIAGDIAVNSATLIEILYEYVKYINVYPTHIDKVNIAYALTRIDGTGDFEKAKEILNDQNFDLAMYKEELFVSLCKNIENAATEEQKSFLVKLLNDKFFTAYVNENDEYIRSNYDRISVEYANNLICLQRNLELKLSNIKFMFLNDYLGDNPQNEIRFLEKQLYSCICDLTINVKNPSDEKVKLVATTLLDILSARGHALSNNVEKMIYDFFSHYEYKMLSNYEYFGTVINRLQLSSIKFNAYRDFAYELSAEMKQLEATPEFNKNVVNFSRYNKDELLKSYMQNIFDAIQLPLEGVLKEAVENVDRKYQALKKNKTENDFVNLKIAEREFLETLSTLDIDTKKYIAYCIFAEKQEIPVMVVPYGNDGSVYNLNKKLREKLGIIPEQIIKALENYSVDEIMPLLPNGIIPENLNVFCGINQTIICGQVNGFDEFPFPRDVIFNDVIRADDETDEENQEELEIGKNIFRDILYNQREINNNTQGEREQELREVRFNKRLDLQDRRRREIRTSRQKQRR